MPDSVKLDTTWEIRHADPIAPGQIVLRVLNDAGIQTFVFERQIFLEFTAQVDKVAAAIRTGII